MATATPTLWNRLTGSLRKRPRHNGTRAGKPPATFATEEALPAVPTETEPPAEAADRAGPLARWSRRDQAIIQLQEGYEKVTRVIEDIQQHLVQQGERSERICGALEQIARSMTEGPQLARRQGQILEQISAQLDTANARTQQLTQAVGEFPAAARAQAEMLAGISRQIEVSNEQRVVASQNMDRLGTSLRSLGETSQVQGEILKEMNVKAAEQGRHIAQLITEQSKRFQMLFIATIGMAAMAVLSAVIGLTLRP